MRRVLALLAAASLLAAPIPVLAAYAAQGNIQGVAGNNATPATDPVLTACLAASAEPTAATNGQQGSVFCDLVHKLVTSPYANRENYIRGYASTTGSTATTVIAAQGAGVKSYITGLQCWNTSAATITVTLDDSASTVIICPTGGGSNIVFETPLVTAANTAFTFTPGSAETTIGLSAQGYGGY